MKKYFLFLILLVSTNTFAQTITGAAATIALDEMEGTLGQTIENAENAGNSVINNGAAQASYLIYNFRVAYKDMLRESDKFITQESYEIFSNIKKVTEKISSGAMDFMTELDHSLNSLNTIMSTIPFFSKRPFISKSFIPTLVKNSMNDEYELYFTGSRMDSKSKFKVNGITLEPSELSSNKLAYILDGKLLTKILDNKKVKFNLKFTYGIFRKKADFSYFTRVIPYNFATVQVEASTSKNDTTWINRTERMPATRTGGSNWRGKRKTSTETFNIYPLKAKGNEIIVESIRLRTIESRYGIDADIRHKSPAAITVRQRARSENEPYGGGGKVQSELKFKEISISESTGMQTLKSLPLNFDEPLVVKLPANTMAVGRIMVKLYDGKTIVLTTENKNKNFEVDYRKLDQTLFIKNVRH